MALSTLPAPAPGHPLQGQATALALEACACRNRAVRLDGTPAGEELSAYAALLNAHADRLVRRILADQAEQLATVEAAREVCARALLGPDDGEEPMPDTERPDDTEYDGLAGGAS